MAPAFTNGTAAALAGAGVGDVIVPAQAVPVKRSVRTGNPVYTAPGNQFPSPEMLDTARRRLACVPTNVLGVQLAP
jgi:hypothetical protein